MCSLRKFLMALFIAIFIFVSAASAEVVIVEAEKIVEVGELDPDYVMTPYIFVDYIVGGDK